MMKIEGYIEIEQSEWRMQQYGETLHIISQNIDSRGYLLKTVSYFKKNKENGENENSKM